MIQVARESSQLSGAIQPAPRRQPSSPPRLHMVFWETTTACNLTCAHCRRTAIAASPDELSTQEAIQFLEDLNRMGRPVLVFSGGEALMRPDFFTLAQYANNLGLPTALASNGHHITAATARRIQKSGIRRVAVSLDGASATTHDELRRLPGSFKSACEGLCNLRNAGISTQINCTITKKNIHQQEEIFHLAETLEVDALHTFLMVPVGCGANLPRDTMLSPLETEKFLAWFYQQEHTTQLQLKATCSPQAIRIRNRLAHKNKSDRLSPSGKLHRHSKGCLAGSGVIFLGHTGLVSPCGYLPLNCGSIREQSLSTIWRESPQLAELRDSNRIHGPCAACADLEACGGCRAQSFAQTGDLFGSDPQCFKAQNLAKN